MTPYLDAFVPAFGLLLLGAALKRVLLPDDRVWAGMERLIFWVLLPSLIATALSSVDLGRLPLGRMALAIWGALGLGVVVSVLLARALGHGHAAMTSVLQGGIRFNNLMGFAICGALFGAPGLALAAVATGLIVPCVQVVTTLAFAFGRGEGTRPDPLRVLRQIALNPLLIAVAVGFALAAAGGLPPGLAPLVGALGRASVVLGLLCVGAALSLDALRDRIGTQALTGALKLVAMPALTWGFAAALGLPALETTVAVTFMALPTAATSYIMARAMGGDAPLMAAITTTEHAASVLTLPVWLALLAAALPVAAAP
jgi:malonate transporter and related proteins